MPERPGQPGDPRKRGRDTGPRTVERPPAQRRRLHHTEQDAIRELFAEKTGRDVHPIASESFIERSKGNYGRPWLAREIIQNFVDHGEKGTLNDVRFSEEALDDGFVRFAIAGAWPFTDPTPLLSPDSNKEDGPSAGGNGIGLKQVALLLFRDHGVRRFDIFGEKWKMPYEYHTGEAMRAAQAEMYAARSQSPAKPIQKGWLMGSTAEHTNTGQCGYVIETDNPELIATLRGLKELGVSADNPYLQGAQYQSEHGMIKWLPVEQAELTDSRMFLNGQVMQFKEKGPDENNYWTGPEHAVVAFHNTEYEMSIDRPAMNQYKFGTHFENMVRAMSLDEIIEQLHASEHLWKHYGPDSTEHNVKGMGWMIMVSKLVDGLQYWLREPKYDTAQFATDFPGKLLALDKKINERAKQDLIAQGYTLCPGVFSTIGMERVSSVVDESAQALDKKPEGSTIRYHREKRAKENGVEIFYAQQEAKTATALFAELRKVSGDNIEHVEVSPDGKVRVTFKKGLWDGNILIHNLPNGRKHEHKILRTLRGVIQAGLEKDLFVGKHALLQTEKFIYVYNTGTDFTTEDVQLYVKAIDLDVASSSITGGVTVTFECVVAPDQVATVERILTAQPEQAQEIAAHTAELSSNAAEAAKKEEAPTDEVQPQDAAEDDEADTENDETRSGDEDTRNAEKIDASEPPEGAPSKEATAEPQEPSPEPAREIPPVPAPLPDLTATPELDAESEDTNDPTRHSWEADKPWMYDQPPTPRPRPEVQTAHREPLSPLELPRRSNVPLLAAAGLGAALLAGGIWGLSGKLKEAGFGGATAESAADEGEKQLAAEMENVKDPDLESMLRELEKLRDSNAERERELSPGQQYAQWRGTEGSESSIVDQSGYIGSKGLYSILDSYSEADIPIGSPEFRAQNRYRSGVQRRIERIANHYGGSEHRAENFELVTTPTEAELAQLALLRTYVIATTGVRVDNDLFLFTGDGTAGMNIGGNAIGLHRALLDVSFDEALGTMVHEIAHNIGDGHDETWQNAESTLWSAIHDHTTEVARDAQSGIPLSDAEIAMLQAEAQWNQLQELE